MNATATATRSAGDGDGVVHERHRHRYEVNNGYMTRLEGLGLRVAGRSQDSELVEMVEIPDHPWFLACQFHPEFTSSPRGGHPLFNGFVRAALNRVPKQPTLLQDGGA